MPHAPTARPTPDARPYDAILFASFGGPEQQEHVVPFLRNVTRGRGIPDERLEVVGEHYTKLGGRSPINDQNRDLIGRLESELARRGIDLPVYWGNRNWEPYTTDVVGTMHADGHRHVLAIATSAYSSYSSCRQYREDYAKALVANDLIGEFTIDKARAYFNHPGFLEPVLDGTRAAIASLREAGHATDRIRILFSTHSIPDAMADASGPEDESAEGSGGWYVAQHRAACRWVATQLAAEDDEAAEAAGTAGSADGEWAEQPAWELVYQSRSGAPHIPWLEPDINDRMQEIAAASEADAVVVVPIGFVTDHVEVVWDLDTEAKQTAQETGLDFRRVATSGTDPRFIGTLADLVTERLDPLRERAVVGDFPPVPDICGPNCCQNGSPHARPVPADGERLDTPVELAHAMQADPQLMARIDEEQQAHHELLAGSR